GPAREAFEPSRSPRNDRVRVSAGLDRVALFELLVEDRVEAIFARAERGSMSPMRASIASMARADEPPPVQLGGDGGSSLSGSRRISRPASSLGRLAQRPACLRRSGLLLVLVSGGRGGGRSRWSAGCT